MSGKVFLIHWNEVEVQEYAGVLSARGWQVETEGVDGARAYTRIKESHPDIILIYLSRHPSHGRQTAEALRSLKATRSIPIVFLDGKDEVIEKTKSKVPDAVYTSSGELENVLAEFARST